MKLEVAGSTVIPTAVVSAADPADLLYLRFGRESHGVFLKIQNPLSAPLKYQARMRLPGESDLRTTTSCPIRPGGSVFESWPHDIDELVLSDFRLLPDSDGSMVCN